MLVFNANVLGITYFEDIVLKSIKLVKLYQLHNWIRTLMSSESSLSLGVVVPLLDMDTPRPYKMDIWGGKSWGWAVPSSGQVVANISFFHWIAIGIILDKIPNCLTSYGCLPFAYIRHSSIGSYLIPTELL